MQLAPGTYFFKDRDSGLYLLILDGQRVGAVKTRREATKWWNSHQPK